MKIESGLPVVLNIKGESDLMSKQTLASNRL